MRRLFHTVAVSALVALASVASPASGAGGTDQLLRDLEDPSAHVRERAALRLRLEEDIDRDALIGALDEAGPHGRAVLVELVGLHGLTEAAPTVARIAAGGDVLAAEAALRALVLLGDDAVAKGLEALPADDARLAPRRTRLRVLHVRDAVERELLARWRRKGGSYEGRFDVLRQHGWPVQPLLLAMLLDVPLEDRFLASPEDGELTQMQKFLVVAQILRSERRGYRTFRPLRREIGEDGLFDLAAQALMDVGDIDLLGDVLEHLARDLDRAHKLYRRRVGFQLRPFERYLSDAIAEILAAHGRKELLAERAADLEYEAESTLRQALRRREEERAEWMQWYATDLSQLAGVLHRMREFERAAAVYARSIDVSVELGGSPPAIASYNRACALARAGRKDEALDQLDVALRADTTDLTREWVAEDGDLRSLRDDPRFDAILERAFGSE